MKRLQKIGVIVLIVIMGICLIYKPRNVYADSNKQTLIIPIPSNEMEDADQQLTLFQYWALESLLEECVEEDEFLVNREGKRVIRAIESQEMKDTTYFELYNGATVDECIFDIPDELREDMEDLRGDDPYADYDKIQLVIQEFEPIEISDAVVLDLAGVEDSLYLSIFDWRLLAMITSGIFEDDLPTREYRLFCDTNGEILVIADESEKNSIYELGDVSSDIIYELQDGDVELLSSEYGIDVSGYENIVIKFGDEDYDDTYYVLDFTNLNEDDSILDHGDIWMFFVDKELVLEPFDIDVIYDENDNDNELMVLYKYGRMEKIEYMREFTYADNITIDITDNESIRDKYSEFGNSTTFTLKFADPDFLEGEEQKYDLSSEEGARFRLNIPFDKFQESGVVYLDGEEVDPSNYEATEGSTIITFKKAFMDGLGLGNHTLRVNMIDGDVTTTFNIVGESPKTGDNLFLYVGLLLMSIFGFGLFRKYAK